MKNFNNMADDYNTSQSNLAAGNQEAHLVPAANQRQQQQTPQQPHAHQLAGSRQQIIVDEMSQDLQYLSREAPLDGGESTFGVYSQLGSQHGLSYGRPGDEDSSQLGGSGHQLDAGGEQHLLLRDEDFEVNGAREDGITTTTRHLISGGRDLESPTSYVHNEQALEQLAQDNVDIQRPLQQAGDDEHAAVDFPAPELVSTQQPASSPVDRAHLQSDQTSEKPEEQQARKQFKPFLVSFMVDARGGAMRGCRHSGVRIIIPPNSAPQPMRITCRYLRRERLVHPPPLMEGEACASKIMEVGPAGAKFLGPVLIEVPHFASLRGKEREIIVLRSDSGEVWREHLVESDDNLINSIINSAEAADRELHSADNQENVRPGSSAGASFAAGGSGNDAAFNQATGERRLTRIVTNEFPQYFAIISRIRQEVHTIGPNGTTVDSQVVPRVQTIFTEGALTKRIKIGLQPKGQANNKKATAAQISQDDSQQLDSIISSGSQKDGASSEQQLRSISPEAAEQRPGSPASNQSRASQQRPGSAAAKRRSRFLACFGAGQGSVDLLTTDESSAGGDSPKQKGKRDFGSLDESDRETDGSPSPSGSLSGEQAAKRQKPRESLVPEDYYIEPEPALILNVEPKTYGKRLASSSAQTDSKLNVNGFLSTSARTPKKRGGLLRKRRNKTQMTIHCEPSSASPPTRPKSAQDQITEADSSSETMTGSGAAAAGTDAKPDTISMIHDVITSDDQKWRTCTIQTDSDSVTVNYVTIAGGAAQQDNSAAATKTIGTGTQDDGYVSGSGDINRQSSFGKGLFGFGTSCAGGSSDGAEEELKRRQKSAEADEKLTTKKARKQRAKADKKQKRSSPSLPEIARPKQQQVSLESEAKESSGEVAGDSLQQSSLELQPVSITTSASVATDDDEPKSVNLTRDDLARPSSPSSKDLKQELKLERAEKQRREKEAAREEKLRKKQEKEAEKLAKKAEKQAAKLAKKARSASPTGAGTQVSDADAASNEPGSKAKTVSVKFATDVGAEPDTDHEHTLAKQFDSIQEVIEATKSTYEAEKQRLSQEDGRGMVKLSLGADGAQAGELETDKVDHPPKQIELHDVSIESQQLKPILKQQQSIASSSAGEEAEITISEPKSLGSATVTEATDDAVKTADALKAEASGAVVSVESPDVSLSVDSSSKEEKARLKREAKAKAEEVKKAGKEAKERAKREKEELKRRAKEAKAEADKQAKEAQEAAKKAKLDLKVELPSLNLKGGKAGAEGTASASTSPEKKAAEGDEGAEKAKGGKFELDFKLPSFAFKGKKSGEGETSSSSTSPVKSEAKSEDTSDDAEKSGKGGKFDIDFKLPTFGLLGKKSEDGESSSASPVKSADKETADTAAEEDEAAKKAKLGLNFKLPTFSLKGKKPETEVQAEISSPELSAKELKAEAKKKAKEAKAEADRIAKEAKKERERAEKEAKKLAQGVKVDAEVEAHSLSVDTGEKVEVEVDASAPAPLVEIDATAPEVKTDADVSAKGGKLDLSFKLPSFGLGSKKSGETSASSGSIEKQTQSPEKTSEEASKKAKFDIDFKLPSFSLKRTKAEKLDTSTSSDITTDVSLSDKELKAKAKREAEEAKEATKKAKSEADRLAKEAKKEKQRADKEAKKLAKGLKAGVEVVLPTAEVVEETTVAVKLPEAEVTLPEDEATIEASVSIPPVACENLEKSVVIEAEVPAVEDADVLNKDAKLDLSFKLPSFGLKGKKSDPKADTSSSSASLVKAEKSESESAEKSADSGKLSIKLPSFGLGGSKTKLQEGEADISVSSATPTDATLSAKELKAKAKREAKEAKEAAKKAKAEAKRLAKELKAQAKKDAEEAKKLAKQLKLDAKLNKSKLGNEPSVEGEPSESTPVVELKTQDQHVDVNLRSAQVDIETPHVESLKVEGELPEGLVSAEVPVIDLDTDDKAKVKVDLKLKRRKADKEAESTEVSESVGQKSSSASKPSFFKRLYTSASSSASDSKKQKKEKKRSKKAQKDVESPQLSPVAAATVTANPTAPLIVSEMYPSDPNNADGEMILEVNVPGNLIEHSVKTPADQSHQSEVSVNSSPTLTSTMPTSTTVDGTLDSITKIKSASVAKQMAEGPEVDQEATLLNISQMISSEAELDDDATENVMSQEDLTIHESPPAKLTSMADVAGTAMQQRKLDGQGADPESPRKQIELVADDIARQTVEDALVSGSKVDVSAEDKPKKTKKTKEELREEKARKELEMKLDKEAKKRAKEEAKLRKKREEEAKEEAKKQEKEVKRREKEAAKEAKVLAKLAKKQVKSDKKGKKVQGVAAGTPVVVSIPENSASVSGEQPQQPDVELDVDGVPVNTETEFERVVEEVMGEDGTVTKTTRITETKYVTLRSEELRSAEKREMPIEEYERELREGSDEGYGEVPPAISRSRARSSSKSSHSSSENERRVKMLKIDPDNLQPVFTPPKKIVVGPYEHAELDAIRSTPSYFAEALPAEIPAETAAKKVMKKRVKLNNKLVKRALKLARVESKRAKKSQDVAESQIAICDEAARQARKQLKHALKEAKRASKAVAKEHKSMDKVDKKLAKNQRKLEKRQIKLDKKSEAMAKKLAKKREKEAKKAAKASKKLKRQSSSKSISSGSRKSIKLEDIGQPILRSTSKVSLGGQSGATVQQQQTSSMTTRERSSSPTGVLTETVRTVTRDSSGSPLRKIIEQRTTTPSQQQTTESDEQPQVTHTITRTTITEGPDGQLDEQVSERVLTGQEALEAAQRMRDEFTDEEEEEIDVVSDLPQIDKSSNSVRQPEL